VRVLVRLYGAVEDLPWGVAEDLIASGRAQRMPVGGPVAAPAVPYLVGEHAQSLPVRLQEVATVPEQQTAVVPQTSFEMRAPAVLSKSMFKRLKRQAKAAGNGSPS
jgi:hypothetical protein